MSAESGARLRIFRPMLAGASLKDRMIASAGAIVGITLTAVVSTLALGQDPHLPFIVAPMGASAVLLFAVPSSPLAQPWSIIGGNTLSALIGVTVRMLVPDPLLACGIAVGLAIAAMSLTRCLHPPGGAAALTAVVGGPAVVAAGFGFAFSPVLVNSLLLAALAWLFHRFSGHSYPHVPAPAPANTHATADPPPQLRVGFSSTDIDAALVDLGETFDINREDLDRLLRRVELHALERAHGAPSCAEIMSRDVISVGPADTPDAARALLLRHGVRALPVVDASRRVLGVIGLRELTAAATTVGDVMTQAALATAETPAFALADRLIDGRTHAVVIVDPDKRAIGVVTQTDLLAAFARIPPQP